MNTRALRSVVLAAAVLGGASIGPARAEPTGIWMDKDGGTVRIHRCGGALCGTIASVRPQHDPATGRPWTDKKNADPSKRARPLVGVQVLIAMQPAGHGKWSGRLYNSDDGRIYAGHLIELAPGRIRVEGCMHGLCGGENLSRLAAM